MAMRKALIVSLTSAAVAFVGAASSAGPAAAQEPDPLDVVQRQLDALHKGDLGSVMALFTEDAVVEALECVGSPCAGREAVRNAYEFYIAEQLHVILVEPEVSGNTVTSSIEIRSDGVRASGQERILVTTQTEVRDGRVATIRGVGVDFDDAQTTAFFDYLATEGVRFNLKPRSAADQSGSAFLFGWNGRTQAMIGVQPGPEGVRQPAQIYTGSCADLGSPGVSLQDVAGGKSITIADVSLDDLRASSHAVAVFRSEEERDAYAACGDIPALDEGGQVAGPPAAGNAGPTSGAGIHPWWYALAAGVVLLAGGLTSLRIAAR